MNKTILTDCDGCLSDWNPAFQAFMHERGYAVHHPQRHNYTLGFRYDIPQELAMQLAEEFNCSEHIEFLPPYKDAVEYVAKLHNLGYDFIVITSFTDNAAAYEHRRRNLLNNFGAAIKELHTLSISQSATKGKVLEQWKGTHMYWIEDHVENAIAGAELGLNTILIDHPYNRDTDTRKENMVYRTPYHKPWKDIYSKITGEVE